MTRLRKACTTVEGALLLGGTVVFALVRLVSVSKTIWDWDEALFSLGVRAYDVGLHHPHPPGFPVYVGAAKLLVLLGLSADRALLLINVAAAAAIFPAMYVVCRAFRFSVSTSFSAAVLLASLPNVMFYGGTRFSDVPALACVLIAAAVLLHARNSAAALVAGAAIFAAAIGIRVQNVLFAAPALVAAYAWLKMKRLGALFVAGAAAALVLAAAYGGAAVATGPQRYVSAVRGHQEYVRKVDSMANPARPPLGKLFRQFAVRPFRAEGRAGALAALAGIGLVAGAIRRERRLLLPFLTFAPYFFLAWTSLDRFGVSRLSIGYMPLTALLATLGCGYLAAIFRSRQAAAQIAIGCGLAIWMIQWTWPVLQLARRTTAPTVAAMEWLREHAVPGTAVYVQRPTVGVFAELLLPETPVVMVDGGVHLPLPLNNGQPLFFVAERDDPRRGIVFARRSERLERLVRNRFFAVTVVNVADALTYGRGWHDAEGEGAQTWRWMAKRATLIVQGSDSARRLRIAGELPLEHLPAAPDITIGAVNAPPHRFTGTEKFFSATVALPPSPGPQQIEFSTSGAVRLTEHGGRDPRELGIRVTELSLEAP